MRKSMVSIAELQGTNLPQRPSKGSEGSAGFPGLPSSSWVDRWVASSASVGAWVFAVWYDEAGASGGGINGGSGGGAISPRKARLMTGASFRCCWRLLNMMI